jgi:hypothetical protein
MFCVVLDGSHPPIKTDATFKFGSQWKLAMKIKDEDQYDNQTKGSSWRWKPSNENCPSSFHPTSNLRTKLIFTFWERSKSHGNN